MSGSEDPPVAFDPSRRPAHDEVRVQRALEEHRELYLNHLMIARWISEWTQLLDEQAVRMRPVQGRDDHDHPTADDLRAEEEGVEYSREALRMVADHLRQADFVPGGPLYRSTMERSAPEV